MKKKLGYLGIGVVGISILVFCLRYCSGLSTPTMIPQHATGVLQINLRQLEKEIVLDVLKHPLKYLGKKRRKREGFKGKLNSFTKGLTIPKALYFYKTDRQSGWQSVPLQLKDQDLFTGFLTKEGFVKSNQQTVSIYSYKHVHVYIQKERVIFGYSEIPLGEESEILFEPSPFLNSQDERLKALVNSAADLSLMSMDGDFITGDFTKGAFEVSGVLSDSFDQLLVTENAALPTDLMSVNLRLNPDHQAKEYSLSQNLTSAFEKFTHLSVDSIRPSLNGRFSLRLSSIATVQDTIITYAYDDDFNKVETSSFQRVTVPNMVVNMGLSESERLVSYFLRTEAIQEVDGKHVFTPIPVYTFTAAHSEEKFELKSGVVAENTAAKITKLFLNFRPKEYLENPLEIPISSEVKGIFDKIIDLRLQITEDNQVRGKAVFDNPYRNALSQLIRP